MKKLFQALFATTLLTLLSLTGCKEPEMVEEPKLTIQTTITVPAEGGVTTLEYTIENPIEGASLTASEPTAEWVKEIAIDQTQVAITTDHNLHKDATSREASFKLLYNAAEMAEVIISQNALEGTFSITIKTITPESVEVEISASNEQMGWMSNFAPVYYVEENGGIDEYVMLDADAYRNSFYGDLLDDYIFTGSTTKTFTLKNPPLEPMYVWVVGIARTEDELRTPIITAAPVVKEFTFLPYPVINLSAEGSEPFGIAEGSHTLSYTIDNPIEGAEVEVSATDGAENWVSDITIDHQSGTITFHYDANTLAIERTGCITLSYPYAESISYTISQEANKQSEEVTFEILVKEAHYNCVIVDCTPSNTNIKYAIGAIAKSDFEGYYYEGDPTKIPEIDLKATYPNHTFTSGAVSNFSINATYNADTEWYVYAYAVDEAESIATSDVEMVAVTLVDDRPTFEWVQGNGVSGTTLSVPAAGGTYTIAYTINNPTPSGIVEVDEPYDDVLVKSDGKKVTLDQQSQTITFTVSANTTKKSRTTYVYLAYFASEDDTTSDANISLKISQSK